MTEWKRVWAKRKNGQKKSIAKNNKDDIGTLIHNSIHVQRKKESN